MDNNWKTHQTLLDRAKDPNNEPAWEEFVLFYNDFIHVVLRQIKIVEEDIDDATQEILLKLWKYLKTFDKETHKVNFRTWLSKVIKNAAYDYLDKKSRLKRADDSLIGELDEKKEAELDTWIITEWENYITQAALENLETIFSGVAIDVFKQALLGRSTEEIAEEFGITQASARTLRSRVRIRLVEEIKNIRTSQEF